MKSEKKYRGKLQHDNSNGVFNIKAYTPILVDP